MFRSDGSKVPINGEVSKLQVSAMLTENTICRQHLHLKPMQKLTYPLLEFPCENEAKS